MASVLQSAYSIDEEESLRSLLSSRSETNLSRSGNFDQREILQPVGMSSRMQAGGTQNFWIRVMRELPGEGQLRGIL